MLIDFESLERLKFELLDFGVALSGLAEKNQEYFRSLQSSIEKTKSLVLESLDVKEISRLDKSVDAISKKAEDFNSLMVTTTKDFSQIALVGDSFNAAALKFEEMSKAVDNAAARKQGGGGGVYANIGRTRFAYDNKSKSKDNVFMKEIKNIKRVYTTKIAKPLKLPTLGTVGATGLMWLIFGVSEEQRLKAMLGRARNTIESAVDGMVGGTLEKGAKWLRDFSEAAQKFYAMSEQEVLNLGRVFKEAGFSIEETLLKKIGPDIRKGLHGNFASLTLQLDKVLELPGGTMASKAVDYAHRYGMSLKESYQTLEKMAALGRGSEGEGIGSLFFIKNIERSLDPLEQMGYTIAEVVDAFEVMQKRFTEDFGVPKYLAAKEVGAGIQQITQGMSSMSMDWQVYFAENLGYGSGLEGRMNLIDIMHRLANKDDYDFVKEVTGMTNAIHSKTGEKEALTRTILEKGPGFGRSGSRLMMELTKAVNLGISIKSKDLKKKIDELRTTVASAFETEKDKMTGIEQEFNKYLAGMREVSLGVLGLLTDSFAVLIAEIKSLPVRIKWAFEAGGADKGKALTEEIKSKFGGDTQAHVDRVFGGLSTMGAAGIGLAGEVLGNSMNRFKSSLFFDPEKSAKSKFPHLFKEEEAADKHARTKIITVPVASGSVHSAEVPTPASPDYGVLDQLSGKAAEEWKGGKLYVHFYGVDQLGNIRVGIKGSCPRCGLRINDDLPDAEDASVTSLFGAETVPGNAGKVSGQKNVDIYNTHTGNAAKFNPTTPEGMKRLSEMSVSTKVGAGKETEPLDPKLGEIVQSVAERFPGKRIKIYRGATEKGGAGQHSKGKAIDIGVAGVPPSDVFKFIRSTVKGGGKGYYPNQPFIHVDTRKGNAVWVDKSFPGESSKGKTIGGAEAVEWLDKNIGYDTSEEAGG